MAVAGMKKFFKNSKTKSNPVPVPPKIPIEAPIHAQFTRVSEASLVTRRSIDALNSDERGPDSDDIHEQKLGNASLNVRIDSNPLSVGSAPGGQPQLQPSTPVSPTGLSPAPHQVVINPPPPQSHIRPSSPSKPRSPTKKPVHYHLTWPESRAAPDHQTSNGHSKENKSIASFDTKESISMVPGDHKDSKEPKESTLDAIGNFLFGAKHDQDRDRRSIHKESRQPELPWSITTVIGKRTSRPVNM